MSGDNMKSGPDRQLVWEDENCRIVVEENEAGEVTLIRSAKADGGPSRSVVIPSAGLASVSAWLWALSVRRTMSGVGQAMARACEQLRAGQLGRGR
jgi:hypothetical protein